MNDAEYAVVVPARNMGLTIRETLASISEQIRGPKERLVVDDRSDDDTADIARQEGWSVVAGPGRGLGAAQNVALGMVTTKYVSFVDADDCWLPRTGHVLSSALDATGVGAASMAAGVFPSTTPELNSTSRTIPVWKSIALRDLLDENPLTKSATMYRTAAVRGVGGFVEGLHVEDLDMAIRLSEEAHGIIASTSQGVWLRERPDSMSMDAARMLEGQLAAVVSRVAAVEGESAARTRTGVAWRRALARAANAKLPLDRVPLPRELGASVPLPDRFLVLVAHSPVGPLLAASWRSWRRVKKPVT